MSASPVTSVPKGRKGSAAGGGKAWTEEEEVYLLQKRLEKVAYKQIASYLDKTELACRLHYHQLSHGGNRRKRNNSMSSNSSDKSAASPAQSPAGTNLDSGRQRSSSSPSHVSSNGAVQKLSTSTPSKVKGKPLLPKPTDSSTSRKQTPAKSKQLRVNINCNAEPIDIERLARIVELQKSQLWANVAAAYGGSFTPEFLEQCWSKGVPSGPPTPAISPQSKANSPLVTDISTAEDGETSNIIDAMAEQTSTPSAQPSELEPIAEKSTTEPQSPKTKAEPSESASDVTMSEPGEPEANWTE